MKNKLTKALSTMIDTETEVNLKKYKHTFKEKEKLLEQFKF